MVEKIFIALVILCTVIVVYRIVKSAEWRVTAKTVIERNGKKSTYDLDIGNDKK